MDLFIFGLLVLFFVWSSQRWGVDSHDSIESGEWQRRSDYSSMHLL